MAADLGEPLSGVLSLASGHARLYERGLTLNGGGGEIAMSFAFPMIGRPNILTGDPAAAPPFELEAMSFDPGHWQLEHLTPILRTALAGRLALVTPAYPVVSASPNSLRSRACRIWS
jgi:hypothetical protein